MDNKPDCLILPPDFIYTDEFHYTIKHRIISNVVKICEYENGYLWYHAICCIIGVIPRPLRIIRGFCQSIYGICETKDYLISTSDSTTNLFAALLYLDNMSYLPFNLMDKYYYYELKKKYHCYMPRKLSSKEYRLISSRKDIDG